MRTKKDMISRIVLYLEEARCSKCKFARLREEMLNFDAFFFVRLVKMDKLRTVLFIGKKMKESLTHLTWHEQIHD